LSTPPEKVKSKTAQRPSIQHKDAPHVLRRPDGQAGVRKNCKKKRGTVPIGGGNERNTTPFTGRKEKKQHKKRQEGREIQDRNEMPSGQKRKGPETGGVSKGGKKNHGFLHKEPRNEKGGPVSKKRVCTRRIAWGEEGSEVNVAEDQKYEPKGKVKPQMTFCASGKANTRKSTIPDQGLQQRKLGDSKATSLGKGELRTAAQLQW